MQAILIPIDLILHSPYMAYFKYNHDLQYNPNESISVPGCSTREKKKNFREVNAVLTLSFMSFLNIKKKMINPTKPTSIKIFPPFKDTSLPIM